ncbi:hypothetical protein [Nonomuraea jabiensis]|uniref:hypothetical protein n=1 Tax=Nonomuraea jabiensis TaxID=882448 RepID=UPI00367F875E
MAKITAGQPVPARRADAERNIAAILEAGTRLLSADPTASVADAVLADDSLDTVPAPEAMARLLHSSWEVLDRHCRLFLAADRVLATERIREHHERPLRRVERLIVRGQRAGEFRTDLPPAWLGW